MVLKGLEPWHVRFCCKVIVAEVTRGAVDGAQRLAATVVVACSGLAWPTGRTWLVGSRRGLTVGVAGEVIIVVTVVAGPLLLQ
jgi:hypothetical protein